MNEYHLHSVELDRHDRWLLEMVVEWKYPLELLASTDLHLHLNRPGHGLPVEEVAARVHRLQREGLIELYDKGEIKAVLAVHSPAELAAFFEWSLPRKDWDRYFGLTTQGGAIWEELAHPDWSRYIDYGTDDDVEINALDRNRIELVVTTMLGEPYVNRAAEVWRSLVPWQATYWKVLPSGVGYRAPLDNDSEPLQGVWPDELHYWFERVELPIA